MMYNICILGGSSIYTSLLFDALIKHDLFESIGKITLFGRDEEKLKFIAKIGNHALTQNGLSPRISYTTDFIKVLDDEHNIIFNQIRFGGMQARNLDEKIGIRNNLFIDETLGIVGVSNAMRTIISIKPFLDELTLKKKEFLIINFTNPASIVTQFIQDYYSFNVLGICDYPNYFKMKIADFLGLDNKNLEIKYFGLNHFSIIYDLLFNGASIFDLFKEKINSFELQLGIQKYFDYIFIPSWNSIFYKGKVIGNQSIGNNRASFLLEIENEYMEYMRSGTNSLSMPPMLAKRNCEWYEIGIIPLLKTYFGIDSKKEVIVNTNGKNVLNISNKNSVIETNACFRNGIAVPLSIPEQIKNSSQFEYIRLLKCCEFLLLEGILERRMEKVIESCIMNPFIQDADKTIDYFRELSRSDQFLTKEFDLKLIN